MIFSIAGIVLGHGVGAAISYLPVPEWGWTRGLRFWHFRVLKVPYFIYPLVIGIALLGVGLA